METFVGFGAWRNAAVLLNLVAFFFGFSAFSVGLLIAARVKRLLAGTQGGMLGGLVHAFLLGSGALALRSLAIVLFHLNLLPRMLALPIADLSLLVLGASLFWAYVIFDRFLDSKEQASG
ncbi:hypothetical protein D3C72_132010 [compost metagenome]